MPPPIGMFLLSLVHGLFCIIQFHSLGDTNALVSVFTSNTKYASISDFPFQTLGFCALFILFIMAATSHDFWLKNLGPKTWKRIHMWVYIAYGLIVLHVALGAFQYESHPLNWILLILGFSAVFGIHMYAGFNEISKIKKDNERAQKEGYVKVGRTGDIRNNEAITICLGTENIAVYKYENKISAVSNQCKHQLGPLGEGKIIDGCITCPWHGYQYLPDSGQSPPPFKEKIKTYKTRIINNEIWIQPKSEGEGKYVTPSII